MEMSPLPLVKLRPRKLRADAPWYFTDEIALDRRTRTIEPGSIVRIEGDGQTAGLFAFNAASKITARLLDRNPGAEIDAAWFAAKIARALELRGRLFDGPFYRLIHAEADGMPGVIIDRFGDAAVVQPNAAWADARFDLIADALGAAGMPNVVMNGSGRARSLEGLAERTEVARGRIDPPVEVTMNGAHYIADLIGGQKTGLFFDQRPNHAFAARLARGADVLDVFAHVGGFALAALAGGAKSALAVDSSASALELAAQGAAAGGHAQRLQTRKGDAFAVMEALTSEAARFGLVIADPPAFAPSKPALDAGLRAYAKVARQAATLTAPGGYLVLCSCSHAADLARFRAACVQGIGKAGRQAQLLHTGGAGPDHPQHPHLAESGYLKALFFRLD